MRWAFRPGRVISWNQVARAPDGVRYELYDHKAFGVPENGVQVSITQRRKGAEGEREVLSLLKAAGWPNVERTSNGRAQNGKGDVRNGPRGVHIEIKRQEKLNICAALDQAIDDAGAYDIPVIVHRPSRHEWMATLPADELFALLAARETR